MGNFFGGYDMMGFLYMLKVHDKWMDGWTERGGMDLHVGMEIILG